MERIIDEIRSWIAMEKAMSNPKLPIQLKPIELYMMYAIKSGYQTTAQIAAYVGYIQNGKASKKRIGTLLQGFCRFKYITTGEKGKTWNGYPMYIYSLTKEGKDLLNTLEANADAIYHNAFTPNTDENLKLYTQ